MTTLPSPESLLPHAAPMVLLDTLDAADDESVTCSVLVRADLPFVVAGFVPNLFAVELMAQAVGVHVGYLGTRSGQPIVPGYLLGVREATASDDGFRVGERLRVEVRRLFGDAELATYSGTVSTDAVVRFRGSVNVYRESP